MALHLRVRFALLISIIRYRLRALRLALAIRPIAGADGDGSGSADAGTADGDTGDGDGDGESAEDNADSDAGDGESAEDADAGSSASEPDWKRMARKHEREAKKARREAEQLRSSLAEREDADKSEQQKAIEEAGQQARKEVEAKFETERRQDRLELATSKLAGRGLKIGTGDDAKTVRFADPDDALVHLERDIRNGDLDPEDIFDDNGKVRAGALEEALSDLLARKPHLAAGEVPPTKVAGSADAGKGTATPAEENSVEDHFKAIRRAGQRPPAETPVAIGRRRG